MTMRPLTEHHRSTTKYVLAVFCSIVLVGLIGFGLWQYGFSLAAIDDSMLIYIYVGLIALPLSALIVGLIIIKLNHRQLHYFPQAGDEAFVWLHQTPQAILPQVFSRPAPPPAAQAQPAWMQYSVGLLEAVLFDFSSGLIRNPALYHPEFQKPFSATLAQLQTYLQRGWTFHFELYTHEPYQVVLRQQLSPTESIVEFTGLCNYYYQRDGESHPTPHSFDTSAALIRVPAVFRLRLLQHPQTGQWQLAGLYESITGSQMGLTTG